MVTSLALFGLRQAPGALAGDAGHINWYRYRAVAMAGAVAYTELMVVAGRVQGLGEKDREVVVVTVAA